MEKILAPAVFSAKQGIKRALEMKSFMNETIAGGQIQFQNNQILRQQRQEERLKMQEKKTNDERKIAQKQSKEKKEKSTNDLTSLLSKGI
jgi:hypothetical protein